MKSDKGFSLVELSISLLIAGLMVSTVVPGFLRGVQLETARATAAEIGRITEAVRAFQRKERVWPQDWQSLRDGGYMPAAWEGKNPFGGQYVLSSSGAGMTLETEVPAQLSSFVARLTPISVVQEGRVQSDIGVAQNPDAALPIGSMIPWPAATIPEGWLACDGRAISREQYSLLFALIGTVYGAGDGTSTFALPDLRGRVPIGLDNMTGSAANVVSHPSASVLGGRLGAQTHVLTISEMPAHRHNMYDYTFSENQGWGGSAQGNAESLDYDNIPAVPYFHPTESVGGGQAHNNMQPSLAVFWIIRCG